MWPYTEEEADFISGTKKITKSELHGSLIL